MSWGTLFREHRWQKLFSIGMAVMIWLTVSTDGLRIARAGQSQARMFHTVPITVLASVSSLGRYQVSPSTVRVELQGDPDTLEQFPASSLQAYVNLVDLHSTPQMVFIQVNPPPGTRLVSLNPVEALVDRVSDDVIP